MSFIQNKLLSMIMDVSKINIDPKTVCTIYNNKIYFEMNFILFTITVE